MSDVYYVEENNGIPNALIVIQDCVDVLHSAREPGGYSTSVSDSLAFIMRYLMQ